MKYNGFLLCCALLVSTTFTSHVVFAQSENSVVFNYYEEAVIQFNLGDYEASYIHLKNALDEDDSHLPSKILMGRLLLINKFPEAAVVEFEEALLAGADPNIVIIPLVRSYIFIEEYAKATQAEVKHLSPENTFEVYLLKASAYRNLNNSELAFTFYQKARLLQPNNVRVLNSMASLYMAGEVWGKALETIEMSLAIAPNAPKTLHLHGHFMLLQGDLERALDLFTQAYKLQPHEPVFQRSLASVYLRLDEQDKALNLLGTIVAETPDPFSKMLYARLLNKEGSEEASRLYQEVSHTLSLLPEDVVNTRSDLALVNALSAYYQENFEQATVELQRYIKSVPNNVNALKLLIDSLIQLDRYLDATRILEQHDALVKRNMPLTVTLCNLYFELQRGFKCESIIRELRVVMQDESTLNLLEVRSLNNRGASAEALVMFEKHFNNVQFPFLRQLHIELLLQNNQVARARSIVDAEISLATLAGDMPFELYLLNTMVLMQEGELVAALREVDNVFALEPNSSSAKFLRAQILSYLSRYDDSIALLQKMNPQFSPVEVQLLIAKNLQSKGSLSEAEKILDSLHETHNKNPAVLVQMMNLYKAQRNYENALWINQKLQKTSFLNVNYMIEQAHIYLLANQLENAVVTFEKIANLVKDDASGLIRLAQLQNDAQLFDQALANIRSARGMLNRKDAIDMQARVLQASIMYQSQQWDQALALARSVVLDTYAREDLRLIKVQSMFIVAEIFMLQSRFPAAAELFAELFNQGMPNQAAPYLYELATKHGLTEHFTQSAETLLKREAEQHFVRRLLADYYLQQNQPNAAYAHYEHLSKIPDVPFKHQVLNNMANILVETNLAKAEQLIAQAFNIEQYDAHVIDTMGWIDFKKGNYLDALRQFRKAYVLDSTDPGIKFHLAYVLVKLNREQEAISQLDRLFAEHQEFPQRARAETLLSDISS